MMPVIEYLNVYCYRNDKMQEKQKQEEKWKRSH